MATYFVNLVQMRNESNLVGYDCRATHDESIHNLPYDYVGARLGCNIYVGSTNMVVQAVGLSFLIIHGLFESV